MNAKRILFFLFSIAIVFVFACSSKFPGFKQTKNGLYYKYHIKGDCDAFAVPGDLISFQMLVYNEDTVFSDEAPLFERQMMDSSRYKGDLYEALGMLCEGDSATFIFSADSLKKHFGLAFDVDSASYLHIDLVMREIMTPEMVKAEEDSLIAAELELFDRYVKDSLEGYAELSPGVMFKEHLVGKGPQILDTSIISLKMSAYTIDGEVFIPEDDQSFDFRLSDDNRIPFNWEAALLKMHEGGKASLVLTSPNAFGKRGFSQGDVGPFQSIRLELEVVRVSAGMKEFEGYSIQQFVKRNEIKGKPTASGMYYVVQQIGTGTKLQSKDKVKVHYTGYYLDMSPFDSSHQKGEPMEVTVDESDVIKGWHQALKMMRVGERARIILPSSLGYGKDGMPPVIRPYSPLIFDLEVVEKI